MCVQLGIQFIQIGSDSQARSFLEQLDNDLNEKHSIRVRMYLELGILLHVLQFKSPRIWLIPEHALVVR